MTKGKKGVAVGEIVPLLFTVFESAYKKPEETAADKIPDKEAGNAGYSSRGGTPR